MSKIMKDGPMHRAEYLHARLAEDIAEMSRLLTLDAQIDPVDHEGLARVHRAMDVIQRRYAFTLEKWKELVLDPPHRAKPDLQIVPDDVRGDEDQKVA